MKGKNTPLYVGLIVTLAVIAVGAILFIFLHSGGRDVTAPITTIGTFIGSSLAILGYMVRLDNQVQQVQTTVNGTLRAANEKVIELSTLLEKERQEFNDDRIARLKADLQAAQDALTEKRNEHKEGEA